MTSLNRLLSALVIAVLVVVTVMLTTRAGPWVSVSPTPAASPRNAGAGATEHASPSPLAMSHVFRVGLNYPRGLSDAPTAHKDQSKLWFHDGSWWGVLTEADVAAFRIYHMDPASQEWTDTGTHVDDRSEARADVLWDGTHLYIASGGRSSAATHQVLFMRYSYDPVSQTYTLDEGFPIELSETGVRSLTIAEDGAGTLWLSYIAADDIWVRDSTDKGESWATPTRVPAASAVTIHTMVAYGTRTAMIWTSQSDGAVYFTSHADGEAGDAWDEPTTVTEGAWLTDDHISAAGLDGPDGATVYVMVKTSRDVLPHSSEKPQMLLLEMRADGRWFEHVYGLVQDRLTRPLILVDEDRRVLHLFAVAPFGGGSVYYKTTPADDIDLVPGRGAPVLKISGRPGITDPTSTKQKVSAESGVLILASDEATEHYVHAMLLEEP